MKRFAQLSFEADDKQTIERRLSAPDDTVYLTTSSFDTSVPRESRSGGSAFHLGSDGAVLWRYDAPAGFAVDAIAANSNGSTYLTLNSESRYSAPRLVALDEHGQERWSFEPKEYPHQNFETLRLDGDRVVVKAERTVTSLSAADGSQIWQRELGIYPSGHFHVDTSGGDHIFANDNFYSAFGYDSFEGFDREGRPLEKDWPATDVYPLLTEERLVYAGEENKLFGISRRGGDDWELEVDVRTRDLLTPKALPGGPILFPVRGGDRYLAVTPEGELLWDKNFPDRARGSFDTPFKSGADGKIYFLKDDHQTIVEVQPDGTTVEHRSTTGLHDFVPTPGGLVALDEDSNLRLILPGRQYTEPVELENPWMWNLEAGPGGSVELTKSDAFHRLEFTVDGIVQREMERVGQQRPPLDETEIVIDEDWLIVGDTPVPIQH